MFIINEVISLKRSLSRYLVLVRKSFQFCYFLDKYNEKQAAVSFYLFMVSAIKFVPKPYVMIKNISIKLN
jgi:hypothetical protein